MEISLFLLSIRHFCNIFVKSFKKNQLRHERLIPPSSCGKQHNTCLWNKTGVVQKVILSISLLVPYSCSKGSLYKRPKKKCSEHALYDTKLNSITQKLRKVSSLY